MATWPATIPQEPVAGGWDEVPDNNLAKFAPEVGREKRRRRYTGAGSTAQARFSMTDAQYATLLAFYRDDCKDGALPFTWDHPVTGETREWLFDSPPRATDDPQAYLAKIVTMTFGMLP